jgi:hypothetical protein
VRYIERSLLRDALGEDNGLRDVELQASIFLEDGLELSQDLEGHTEFGLDVPIIMAYATARASWNLANTRPHKWCIVRLNISISKGSPCRPPVLPFAK